MHYFGPWDDWEAAYSKYQYEIPYLLQGKTPPPQAGEEGLGIAKLVNKFLAHREALVESGELTQRTWDDYKRTGELLVAELGRYRSVDSLRPSDFAELRVSLSRTVDWLRCRVRSQGQSDPKLCL